MPLAKLSKSAAVAMLVLAAGAQPTSAAEPEPKGPPAFEAAVTESHEALRLWAGLAHGLHVGGGRHHGRKSALRALDQPADLVVRKRAVGVALQVGQRGQNEAVRHGRSAGEGERLGKAAHGSESPCFAALCFNRSVNASCEATSTARSSACRSTAFRPK